MITLENVLEEVVGSIQDEFDHETGFIIWLTEAHIEAEVKGACPLERFAKASRWRLGESTADTVGGYFTELNRGIPEVGQTIQDGELKFEVLEMDHHAVSRLKVSRTVG